MMKSQYHPDKASSTELLNVAYERITRGQITEAMDDLLQGLSARRMQFSQQEWASFIAVCLEHPLRQLLHQDPLTCRAFTKPRGYSGDAVLLDLIYSGQQGHHLLDSASFLGRELFNYTVRAPAPRAVRARLRILADTVDSVARQVHNPRILSVASGHLREAGLSTAVQQGGIGEYIALDQDSHSLKEVERCCSRYGVRTIQARIRELLTGQVQLGLFDLIYAAGLYDYLPQPIAEQLTDTLFRKLHPGGRLLLANFVPDIRDVGYLETYMTWNLIYRAPEELQTTARTIPPQEIEANDTFIEENGNIVFLQVQKVK
jgi:hypothetical protein